MGTVASLILHCFIPITEGGLIVCGKFVKVILNFFYSMKLVPLKDLESIVHLKIVGCKHSKVDNS